MDELRRDPTQNPLEKEPDLNVADRVRMLLAENELPEPLSEEEQNALIDLLEQIFVYDPARRSSAEFVRNHRWLKMLEKYAQS